VPELQTLMTGIVFGESPRWHDDRLWFSDWGAQEVVAVDLEGQSEVIVRIPSFPFCIDWLPDGRLLIVSARDRLLLRREPDGSLVTHTDLSGLSEHPWNDIVVDGRGNAYVGNTGFDFPGGEFASGILALVIPHGTARQVADGVAFPNGMVVTPDKPACLGAWIGEPCSWWRRSGVAWRALPKVNPPGRSLPPRRPPRAPAGRRRGGLGEYRQ
jgi:sugar lactone lactonase YvrE